MADGLWVPSGAQGSAPSSRGSLPAVTGSQQDRLTLDAMGALARGRSGAADDSEDRREMRLNRRVARQRNAGLAKLGQAGEWNTAPASNWGGGGSSMSFATGRPRDPLFYWEQNNLPYDIRKPGELMKIRAWCNTPDAPIWMGDYSFKSIGEIVPGDEVIGWEWYQTGRGLKSRLVKTKVLATNRRLAPEVVRVMMESGRVIRCTPDHLWANALYSPGAKVSRPGDKWSSEYIEARPGAALRHVIDPTPDLQSEKERVVAAWLGGLYDGEGTWDSLTQCEVYNPEVRQRIKDSLDFLGIPYHEQSSRKHIRISDPGAAGKRGANGTKRQHLVNFLNWTGVTRSRRKLKQWDELLLTANFGNQDRVVSVESEGPGEVISMQTETGNYTAWGYASKNCRLLYLTHPIIASCIDIYSKLPVVGCELRCKDEALVEFHTTLFFEQLDYEDYMVDIGREYFTVGEAFPLGQFNEMLGVWEDDELINPDDVEVIKTPFQREPRFEMRLPESLRQILERREPRWEYETLMANYPELAQFLAPDQKMPVSNVLLKHLKFKADTFHPRGIPILMRGFRATMQEEMLNAAQDAIADRLYTPLILARLGASASDLGTTVPWIPNENDLEDFEEALDAALAADFRVLTHHFALQMDSVFGRETMPNFGPDFDRLEDRLLQVFGLSRTMLSGADSGETYAADALNRDLSVQILSRYQKMLKRLYRDRALVVAEAQEHYDYEERGGKKYPIMEEILEKDEESGEERIVERPKLLVPTLEFKDMTFQGEQMRQQLLEALKASGVPISMKTRLINVPVELEDEIEKSKEEQVALAVAAQETRKDTYKALTADGLPIPQDLVDDFQPHASDAPTGTQAAATPEEPDLPLPSIGAQDPNAVPLSPTMDDYAAAEQEGGTPGEGDDAPPGGPMQAAVIPLPRSRPSESDEMRASMPKPASKIFNHVMASSLTGDTIVTPIEQGPHRLQMGPSTVGHRRRVDPTLPWEEQLPEADDGS